VTALPTIAVFSTGDMGHAVGRVAVDKGCRVVTALDGRSDRSGLLAASAGIEDLGDLAGAAAAADIILSILPPSEALTLASQIAASEGIAGKVYVDCNAISPARAAAVCDCVTAGSMRFVDGGIIGPAPIKAPATRLYLSGADREQLFFLEDERLTLQDLGPEPGRASAIKMCYAALTKGSWTLFAALSTAAHRLGVGPDLDAELADSQAAVRDRQRAMLPRLPLDAGRWVGEMEEIAATFEAAGLPGGFHQAAADMFRLLDGTPYAAETRQDWDTTRTPEQTVAAVSDVIESHGADR